MEVMRNGAPHTVEIRIEDIIEAEGDGSGFNFIRTVAGFTDGVRFTDLVKVAGLLTVDGVRTDYGRLVADGWTVPQITDALAGVMTDLGFTSAEE